MLIVLRLMQYVLHRLIIISQQPRTVDSKGSRGSSLYISFVQLFYAQMDDKYT